MIASARIPAAFAAVLLACSPAAATDRLDADLGALINREIQKCWNPPPDAGRHVITVRFELKRDGSLATRPVVTGSKPENPPASKVAAAKRAVMRCTPLALPGGSYDTWREIVINFDDAFLARPPAASPSPQ